jgi:hypothetical protein
MMSKQKSSNRVNIRPGVAVLSVLRHLNYRPWFALAEFIDNAVQSFLLYRDDLKRTEGEQYKLRVDIDVNPTDGGRISIRDNACGIKEKDFPRAFRPAELPMDRSGLGEFGMGMKSAACWFSPQWSVRTSALGEAAEKTVVFDISKIVRDEIEELDVAVQPTRSNAHFTEIVLTNLHHMPAGRTLGKIKEHLRDIYRIFVREGNLVLRLNDEDLIHEEPEILEAPLWRDANGPAIRWRKELQFDFGNGLKAHGFAAIRKVASTSRAGFALFRRKRLIQGSGDEGYRPEFIFGKPNSFIYQRIFGELHLEGFEVSHTKDGFQWDENEEPFLQILKENLSESSFPLLQQAREYRVQARREDIQRGAELAVENTSSSIREHVPAAYEVIKDHPVVEAAPETLAPVTQVTQRIIDVEFNGRPWKIILELSYDPAVGEWLEISDHIAQEHQSSSTSCRVVGLRLSLSHPFMERFGGLDADQIEPLLRVAAALGLAEVAARDGGVRGAGTIRRNVNELLRNALSRI